MKPMLKAKFYELVNSLLARGIKPELKIALHNNWGNLIWEENGSKMVEPLFSSVSTRQSAIRFQSWFADIMAAHKAGQKAASKVKPLRTIGDDVEYHIVLDGKEYKRCFDQYFIRTKNPHNGPYPFWRAHHGKNVHARIDAAIAQFEAK